jgi:hypothetical protein
MGELKILEMRASPCMHVSIQYYLFSLVNLAVRQNVEISPAPIV